MAFKILSPNELAILSEAERKEYETAYGEYLERTAFIDRLEQLEKVQMPRVSVKKKGIKRIKAPSVPSANMQRFTADTVQGNILLNATKRVKAVLDSNVQAPSIAEYKVSLPCVGVASPVQVSIETNNCYKVNGIPDVPIVAKSEVKFERKEYKISDLHYPQHITPDISQVKINSYTVSGLPTIDTSTPDISITPLESTGHRTLENVPIAKPTVIDTVITKYEVSSCEKAVATAPEVKYTPHEVKKIELCTVPVPKPQVFKCALNTTKIDIPMHLTVSAPEISVTVSSQKISSLEAVVIPTAAPTASVVTASVKQVPSPVLATPDVVKYAAPNYHAAFTSVSSVSAPVIDEKKELDAILAKIR